LIDHTRCLLHHCLNSIFHSIGASLPAESFFVNWNTWGLTLFVNFPRHLKTHIAAASYIYYTAPMAFQLSGISAIKTVSVHHTTPAFIENSQLLLYNEISN